MSLSDDERSALAEIEARLEREDPRFLDWFRRHGAPGAVGAGHLHVGVALFVVGLVVLVAMLEGPVAIPLAGVGAMYAGALLVTRWARTQAGAARARWRARFDVPASERYGYRP